jgi:hypothetical protein
LVAFTSEQHSHDLEMLIVTSAIGDVTPNGWMTLQRHCPTAYAASSVGTRRTHIGYPELAAPKVEIGYR